MGSNKVNQTGFRIQRKKEKPQEDNAKNKEHWAIKYFKENPIKCIRAALNKSTNTEGQAL
jgi:Uri superfamily endonuclease